jgi:hypothetical protein
VHFVDSDGWRPEIWQVAMLSSVNPPNSSIQNSPSGVRTRLFAMASSSIASLVSAAALPAGAVNGARLPPSSVRLWCHDRARRQQQRLVAAAAKRRYKGTAMREVAEAIEACAGRRRTTGAVWRGTR